MFRRRTICRVGTLWAAALAPALAAAQTGVPWRTNFDAAKVEAAQTNRLVLVHFWTQTCGPCKVLDQTVFNQPHVGAALERDFVPIKVDCDAAPALKHFYRIDSVPTDVVLGPQGEVVAKLSCPNTAEAYLGQLQTLSRHVRQTKAAGSPAAQEGPVNAAYANLPTARPANAAPAPAQGAPASDSRYASPSSPTPPPAQGSNALAQRSAPHSQSNPYVPQAPAAGQAQPVYPQPTGPGPASAAPPANAGPTTPANAMPRSYQASLAANQPATTPSNPAQPVNPPMTPAAQPAAPVAGQYAGVAGPPRPQAAAPWTPQLPAGAPPVGLEGYCPVTLKAFRKWAPGNSAFGAIHRGRTYIFAGPRERDQFLADPDAYSPVFAGYDPVLLLEKRQSVPGSRRFGYEFEGRFYLFSSKETMDKFGATPEIARTYASGVRQAMNRIDSAAGGTVRR